MTDVLSRQLLFEIELDHVHTDPGVVDLVGQRSRKLIQTVVRGQRFRLDFVFVSFLVQGKSISRDGGVDSRAEVGVVFNNVPLFSLDLHVFPCFIHLTQNSDSLPLDFSERLFLVLSFVDPDFFSPLSMFLLLVLFPFYEGTLKQVQSLVLESLDLVFPFVPLSELLLLHELPPEDKASLVGGRRQGVLECPLLPHVFNQLHFSHARRESLAVPEVGNGEHLWDVFFLNLVLGGEGVSLSLPVSII